MNVRNAGLSRRAVLRGIGACVALPWMESLAWAMPEAAVSAKPPLRMGIFTVTGGTVTESWVPTEVGALGKMPSVLRALEPFKDDLLVLSNLSQSGRSDNVNAHEHCAFMHLTAADKVGKINGKPFTLVGNKAAESVEQRAARLVSEQSLFPSMEIGLAGGEQKYSYGRDGNIVPYESDPRLVFERMFKGRQMVAPNWKRRAGENAALHPAAAANNYDAQVVDLISDDAKKLSGKLGTSDRHKLGEYLEAVDGIQRRIARTQARLQLEALDVPDPGPSHVMPPDHMPMSKKDSDAILRMLQRNPAAHAEYIRLVADLMVLAFQTDTTRVCTVAVGGDDALFPGVVTVGYENHAHTLEHQGNGSRLEDVDPVSREGCRQIHAWYTQQFAYMVEKMRGIDEGGSTLLDNCMLLYTSYMSNGGHGKENYPVLLAGRAGGTLKPGRHIAYQPDTPMANLYVEMLLRMGDKAGEFGNSRSSSKAAYDGRLPGVA
jgi:hypothetical protein